MDGLFVNVRLIMGDFFVFFIIKGDLLQIWPFRGWFYDFIRFSPLMSFTSHLPLHLKLPYKTLPIYSVEFGTSPFSLLRTAPASRRNRIRRFRWVIRFPQIKFVTPATETLTLTPAIEATLLKTSRKIGTRGYNISSPPFIT